MIPSPGRAAVGGQHESPRARRDRPPPQVEDGHQAVLGDDALDRARHLIRAAARTRRNDEFHGPGRLPGAARRRPGGYGHCGEQHSRYLNKFGLHVSSFGFPFPNIVIGGAPLSGNADARPQQSAKTRCHLWSLAAFRYPLPAIIWKHDQTALTPVKNWNPVRSIHAGADFCLCQSRSFAMVRRNRQPACLLHEQHRHRNQVQDLGRHRSQQQSGHPAAFHYLDQRALWEVGQLHALTWTREEIARVEGQLVLRAR